MPVKSNTGPDAGAAPITLPRDVADTVWREVSKAHLALHALVQMLRVDGVQPDSHGVAYLLAYIESNLERSDDLISPFMH
jgi:hypothetical protein